MKLFVISLTKFQTMKTILIQQHKPASWSIFSTTPKKIINVWYVFYFLNYLFIFPSWPIDFWN